MQQENAKGQQGELVWKNQKKLRSGYTTGSCGAAAAKAAAYMLLSGERAEQVSLLTPKGVLLYLEVEEITFGEDFVSCAVRKDSGDDPDVTDKVLVFAQVSRCPGTGLILDGGEGVGRVTKKGLEQKIGEAAINRVPRRMILEAVDEQREKARYTGGLKIIISVPGGADLANRTFNPRLGIQGGISILGTSGIVEPMSEKALIDTIYLEMKVLKENGHDWCYVVPGNYGSDFLAQALGFDGEMAVKCSNYIGEMIDAAVGLKMKGVFLVGHVGKLIKLAAGVMNTHSRQADCRMEVFAAHAAMAGAPCGIVKRLMECVTTTEAVEILKKEGLLKEVMGTVMKRIDFYLRQRAGGQLQIGAAVFSLEEGILGVTACAEMMLASAGLREQTQKEKAE
ncbi:cobalt-precorrin-5B (C(1))-methyltransferase CbiD [Luxibacter massiliensis]|uniref:cobalt-precorrin-5B (C(1))-methyltransferase CbiD n=1 Tax=Luxibacter massiliensis TaxID=2219695 RepID=UPI000F06B39D|nr:cobalt-precorrin-5B (C(1))-methyltransferase CbiD [Luxibacter massiliensis]